MPRAQANKSAQLPPIELRCHRSDGRKWQCSAWVMEGKRYCVYHEERRASTKKRKTVQKSSAERAKPKDLPEENGNEIGAEVQDDDKELEGNLNNSGWLSKCSDPRDDVAENVQRVRMLRYMLSLIFPVLKDLHHQQCQEVQIETKLTGSTVEDIKRLRLNLDERLHCDNCNASIVDMYRTCPECRYDLCLLCCWDLRKGQQPGGEQAFFADSYFQRRINNLTELCTLPLWRVNDNASIPCPPRERGGCGMSQLCLRRLAKRNWIAKLVASAERAISNEVLRQMDGSTNPCDLCRSGKRLCLSTRKTHRISSFNNHVYCPSAIDVSYRDVEHFQKHWLRHEPVIVRNAMHKARAANWDHVVLWQSAAEVPNGEISVEASSVNSIDCLDFCKVEVDTYRPFSGYQGHICENGHPKTLQLKDLSYVDLFHKGFPQLGVQFLTAVPFHDYTHPTQGVLNLVTKLPKHALKPNLGPKIDISYRCEEELQGGDSITKIHSNLTDVVIVLMHVPEMKSESANIRHANNVAQAEAITSINDGILAECRLDHTNVMSDEVNEAEDGSKALVESSHMNLHDYSQLRISNVQIGEITLKHDEDDIHAIEVEDGSCKKVIAEHGAVRDSEEDTSSHEKHGIHNGLCRNLLGEKGIWDCNGHKRQETGDHGGAENTSSSEAKGEGSSGVVLWDVFRIQDVPKLRMYLKNYSSEVQDVNTKPLEDDQVNPNLNGTMFLNEEHKKRLRNEYGVEPWTFYQGIEEAVFVPAGCPYQAKIMKCCMKVELQFLAPESVQECTRMLEERRFLPEEHSGKEDELEVKRMALYAADATLRELRSLLSGR